MVYWLNTGIPWRDLPERFGPWQNVYSRFRAWTGAGVWEQVLLTLIDQDIVDETTLMPDSTTIKVHQHASGAEKRGTTKKPGTAGRDRGDPKSRECKIPSGKLTDAHTKNDIWWKNLSSS